MINAIEARKLTQQGFKKQQEYVEKYLSDNQNKFTKVIEQAASHGETYAYLPVEILTNGEFISFTRDVIDKFFTKAGFKFEKIERIGYRIKTIIINWEE
jgi:sensor domain CHASE-containing protein